VKLLAFVLLAAACAYGQASVNWNLKCDDGSSCRKDLEPGRCVCLPGSVTAVATYCPFDEKLEGNSCVAQAVPKIKCGKRMEGMLLEKDGIIYECVRRLPKKARVK
jgi:hypothetical protein